MSDYKKKRSSNIRVKSKSQIKYSDEYDKNELKLKRKANYNKEKRIISVKKNKKANKIFTLFSTAVILLVACFVTYVLHPAGIIEYVGHLYKSIGTGSGYDVVIDGGKPIYNVSAENKYFTVNSTMLNCYNKNGKTIFSKQHSFAEPVLKSGDTRYLFYGQGEKELWICTLSETKSKQKFNKGIISAAISKNGSYAVATKADGYDSCVSVFNKNNKKVYEWFSTDSTINSIALSNNGKLVAVSTMKVEGGKFVSKIHILNLKSANPVFTHTYDNDVVYQLETLSSNKFCATFSNKIEFISFYKNNVIKHESDYSLSIFKKLGNRVALVRTVAANQDESLVEIYNPRGKLISGFNVQGHINDIAYKNSCIYLLDLATISKYDLKGVLHSSVKSSYDAMFIEVISQDNIACVNNSSIDKYKLTNVKE